MAALEEGVIVPSTRYYCNGHYPPSGDIGGSTWRCWTPYGHGSPDLITALAQSCDVYFYNVGYAFYNRAGTELADWAMRLGLGKPTGLDIPGEVAGRVPTPEWRAAVLRGRDRQDLEAGQLDPARRSARATSR